MREADIDRLEAGRDADALLAQLIPLPGVRLERVPWQAGKREPYWRYIEGGFREKFQPTTDPAAAAVVLTWLRAFQKSKGVQRSGREGDGLTGASELATCKAALRAVANNFSRPQAPKSNRDGEILSLLGVGR